MRDAILAQAGQVRPAFDAPAPDCAAPGADPGTGGLTGGLSNHAAGRCLVAYWTRRSDLRVVARFMYDDMVTDLRPELRRITAPVTLLYAENEQIGSAERVRALFSGAYQGTPHLTLVPVPGSYHFIMLDQPDRFRAALEAFLAAPQ